MKMPEIVSAVQKSTDIDTHEHAQHAVKATVKVLGQRLSTEAKDLAAQLPPELAEQIDQSGNVERFGLDEFYQRVADAEGQGCTAEQARQHARAVTAALREATGYEYQHMLDQLPDGWDDLLHTGNT